MTVVKTDGGNFFEDFEVGRELLHATPRTVTEGDVALYTALYGPRFAPQSSDIFAMDMGFEAAPIDDWLVFHIVFARSVPDISLNAVANLGYGEGRFGAVVYPGDTLSARSRVIGVKENSNRKTGIVYVRTTGENQRGEAVLEYVRWVMVRKRDAASTAPETIVPELAESVGLDALHVPEGLNFGGYHLGAAGSPHVWDDYRVGEKIDHVDGVTVEEAEHQMATRLYQNTARVHFNQHLEKDGRFARRLVYGGHVISLTRALSFNGLANAFKVVALNGGRHVSPLFAGHTVYAWSEVLDKFELPGREDVGALRLRTTGVKDRCCGDFPFKSDDGAYDPSVVLDVDYTALMARRA
ncbi:MaoC family dehydratase [Varunaivibrio sulfuroxidans]|uniref:L-erythro-3-methylmalyl-CoA dehydratase n=1 Tax=Varunaivibrio sulfuroxidans TaxID=1773489 RepID=A0A4R3JC41_9PROT|nr:MaoC family dehydratase [Varunaivibrio sulfuroxidans]TCS63609.1 L-erythro-3-methylmalyl-CoA dehydratase [Varunaivibrio sulfuroxidans]WES30250.1 MaoC family dehydratase [Varunaivibrio sulfuroxidans]